MKILGRYGDIRILSRYDVIIDYEHTIKIKRYYEDC